MASVHIVVLPGGGYEFISPKEDAPIVDWLTGLGVAASSFAYPVRTRHPAPLDAVRAEIARVRSGGADTVGVLGFSAGGHAAGFAALAPGGEPGERPDFAILGYPVVSMLLPTHAGSRRNLLGDDPTPAERERASLETLVTADAPPFFIWHTVEDASVPVEHSYLLGTALGAAEIPHALHVYPRGEHGLALGIGSGLAEHWTRDCAEWLRENGWIA